MDETAEARDAAPGDENGGEADGVAVRPYESRDFEGVVAMYADYPRDQRAMGIPPLGGREAVAEWVEGLVDRGRNVVAVVADGTEAGEETDRDGESDDGRSAEVVGHAVLVPADGPAPELAVFVAPTHQNRGVGTALCAALVEAGRAAGHDRIVLSVTDANRRARRLYEKLGFEVTSDPPEKLWREMALELE